LLRFIAYCLSNNQQIGGTATRSLNGLSQHNYPGMMLYPVPPAKTKLIESGISRFDVNQGASLRD
jgi:hypothetical protein